MSGTSRYEVVAAAAVKKFREMIESYHGSAEGLKPYLLRQLNKMENRADELLAGIMVGRFTQKLSTTQPQRPTPSTLTYTTSATVTVEFFFFSSTAQYNSNGLPTATACSRIQQPYLLEHTASA